MTDLKKLKKISLKDISLKTHIRIEQIEKLLNEKNISIEEPIAIGFIQIIEREYKLDLSELKMKYVKITENINDNEKVQIIESENDVIFNKLIIVSFISILLIIIIVIYSYFINNSSNDKILQKQKIEIKQDINNTPIIKAKENIKLIKESKTNKKSIEIQKKIQKINILTNVKSKSKVWIGIIDLDKKKKYSKITSNYEIEQEKDLLIVLGHSYISLFIDDKQIEYKKKGKMYLHVMNGQYEIITKDEFKMYNNGKNW